MGTWVRLGVKQGNATSQLLLQLTEVSESCKGGDHRLFIVTLMH